MPKVSLTTQIVQLLYRSMQEVPIPPKQPLPDENPKLIHTSHSYI